MQINNNSCLAFKTETGLNKLQSKLQRTAQGSTTLSLADTELFSMTQSGETQCTSRFMLYNYTTLFQPLFSI
jgi:hypothetical protein